MSPRRKASSGFTDVPPVGIDHRVVEPPIRKVSDPTKEVLSSPRPRVNLLNLLLTIIQIPRKKMLQWIKDRLKEPSTLQGATGLAGVAGYALNPELLELIISTVVSIISIIQIAKNEKLAQKKDNA